MQRFRYREIGGSNIHEPSSRFFPSTCCQGLPLTVARCEMKERRPGDYIYVWHGPRWPAYAAWVPTCHFCYVKAVLGTASLMAWQGDSFSPIYNGCFWHHGHIMLHLFQGQVTCHGLFGKWCLILCSMGHGFAPESSALGVCFVMCHKCHSHFSPLPTFRVPWGLSCGLIQLSHHGLVLLQHLFLLRVPLTRDSGLSLPECKCEWPSQVWNMLLPDPKKPPGSMLPFLWYGKHLLLR